MRPIEVRDIVVGRMESACFPLPVSPPPLPPRRPLAVPLSKVVDRVE